LLTSVVDNEVGGCSCCHHGDVTSPLPAGLDPWAPMHDPPAHTRPQPYHRLLRTRRFRWWKPLLGLPLALACWLVAGLLLLLPAVLFTVVGDPSLTLDPVGDWLTGDSPVALLIGNLSLAALIPAAWAAVALVHRDRIGWLSSVAGRLRWGLLIRMSLLAVALVGVGLGVSFLLPEEAAAASQGPEPAFPGLGSFVALASVILLTTPLQAAGEEYLFRGYLGQVLGAWVRSPWFGGVVTSTLFALAHGQQDAWLFADRFLFGAVAWWLAVRTGGLEAPIALHAVNNVLGLLLAAAFGQVGASLMATDLPWTYAVADACVVLAFGVLAARLAAHREMRTRSDAPLAAVGAG